MVCPYVHIKIGNVKEQSLAEISKKGFSIKHFRNYSPKCLAGEDKDFVKRFMSKEGTTIFKPALADDIFGPEDFVKSNDVNNLSLITLMDYSQISLSDNFLKITPFHGKK